MAKQKPGCRPCRRKRHKGNLANLQKRWLGSTTPQGSSSFSGQSDRPPNEEFSSEPILNSDTSSHEISGRIEKLEGNRIINIGYLFKQLGEITSHGERFGCNFNNLTIQKEVKKGLLSEFILHCGMCQEIFRIGSQETDGTFDINALAVKGIISIGGGYSNLEEFLGCVDVPCMSERTYQARHDIVASAWKKVAAQQMQEAINEEIDYARTVGSVDKNGVPLIEVVVDGAWSKRSYKTKYDALSGVASIIGNHSGKVLYMGVKNKYCLHCARGPTLKSHMCTKNYSGSSSGMEAAILVQGFKCSMEMYGVKYHKIIGDGDSSVYSKILEARPYHDTTIEKIECRNHLLRNFSNKLKEVVTNTKFAATERKLLEGRLLRLRSGVKGAIKFNKQEQETHVAIKKLRSDILNSVAHVFGNHSQCANYFCKKPNDDKNHHQNLSPLFLSKIMEIVRRLANNARSLIYDMDSNVVEHYNSIVAKFIGGKRVNYALKNSYLARCTAAVVSHNTSMAHTVFHKVMLPNNAHHGKIIRRIETRRKIKQQKIRMRHREKIYKERVLLDKSADKDYGEHCQKPDLDGDIYKLAEEDFLHNLQRTDSERKKLEEQTRYQAEAGIWMEERRKLITASNFAKVCKRRRNRDTSKLVENILYRSNRLENVPSIAHGKKFEEECKADLEKNYNIVAEKCGLFIDREFAFIGASPDGVVGNDFIVEIKCPYSAFKLKLSVEDAIANKKIDFWKIEKDGSLKINQKHDWYFQVQGQLRVTQRKTCIFCVWLGHSMKIEYINRDDHFWADQMEKKLVEFYKKAILPELVDSRRERSMPIRTIII